MVLRIYGHPESTNSYVIGMLLKEKNVPFELHAVDFVAKEHKSAAHLKKHPFGQIPYLVSILSLIRAMPTTEQDDDGFILYETRAMLRYIDDQYQGTKFTPAPSDLKAKALFEQAASIEAFNFFPFATQAVREKVYKSYVYAILTSGEPLIT